MILYVRIFLFVLMARFFLSVSYFYFLFKIYLGLVFLCFYELCFLFDFVYDDCHHLHLFFVLFLYCFE